MVSRPPPVVQIPYFGRCDRLAGIDRWPQPPLVMQNIAFGCGRTTTAAKETSASQGIDLTTEAIM